MQMNYEVLGEKKKLNVLNISIPFPHPWIQRCLDILCRNVNNPVLYNIIQKKSGGKCYCDVAL